MPITCSNCGSITFNISHEIGMIKLLPPKLKVRCAECGKVSKEALR